MTTVVGPSDLRDQRWLDERIAAIDDGVEAVLDIARNWTTGRNVSRLHVGVSAAEYVRARVGVLGKTIVVPLLEASDWSNRQIADVAGVDEGTVRNVARTAEVSAVHRPERTLGADGKYRPGRVVREVMAEVIEPGPVERVPIPMEAVAVSFRADARRLVDLYRPHLADAGFAITFGDVFTAIDAVTKEG